VQHEALLNLALEPLDAEVVCSYDLARLPPQAIDDSHLTHPFVQYGTGPARPNEEYSPSGLAAAIDQPLAEPPAESKPIAFAWNDLRLLRGEVEVRAASAGLTPNQVAAAKLAVTEAASNAVRHGGGTGALRIWQEAEHLVFDVYYSQPLSDPLVGRLQPSLDSAGGRGLALINHVCDLVRLHGSRLGTTIRMWFAAPNARPTSFSSRRS
jgi:hypothetical protein